MTEGPTLAQPAYFAFPDRDGAGAGLFTSWRSAMAAVFDVSAEPDEIGTFEGTFNAWATTRFALIETRRSRIKLLRTPETIARSRIDHFAIWLVASGSVAGLAGPTEVDAKIGDVFFIDLLQTTKLQSSVHGDLTGDITLWVPRSRMFASVRDENSLHGLTLKGTSPVGALIGASLKSLAAHVRSMSAKEMDAVSDGVVEMTARAISPILEATAPSGVSVPLVSFVTIRRFIDRNLTSPDLGTKKVAVSFGLSRASLYRLFEPVGGLAGYIRKRRLERAYQEITAPDLANRRIGPIAYRLGFKNISAFSRAFRSAYGVSPMEARENALKGVSDAPLQAEAGEGKSLGRWLMQIAET